MNRQKKKKKDELWAYAKKKYRLNANHIAMAKEIGMNPKKFGSMAESIRTMERAIGGIHRGML